MSLNSIGVIGAGTMGSGIAQVCALAGLQVTLVDVNEAALARGRASVDGNLQRQVSAARPAAVYRRAGVLLHL